MADLKGHGMKKMGTRILDQYAFYVYYFYGWYTRRMYLFNKLGRNYQRGKPMPIELYETKF